MILFQKVHVFPMLRAPELYTGLQVWSPEQRGRIPSLNLLATLHLMRPRLLLAFWVVNHSADHVELLMN